MNNTTRDFDILLDLYIEECERRCETMSLEETYRLLSGLIHTVPEAAAIQREAVMILTSRHGWAFNTLTGVAWRVKSYAQEMAEQLERL